MFSLDALWSVLESLLEIGAVGAVAVLFYLIFRRKDKELKECMDHRIDTEKKFTKVLMDLQKDHTKDIMQRQEEYTATLTEVLRQYDETLDSVNGTLEELVEK